MKLPSRSLFLIALVAVFGCEPEVGSEAWCNAIAEKPKGDITFNEAGEYAKNCVLRKLNNE